MSFSNITFSFFFFFLFSFRLLRIPVVYMSFKLVYILIFKYSDRTHACGEGIIGVGVVREQGLRKYETIRGGETEGGEG